MGDGADMALDDMFEDEEARLDYRAGYMDDTEAIEDNWVFYCSRERHNEIVKKFREYMKNKKEVKNG